MARPPFPDSQTYQIIGAAIAVHTELGCGFLEAVYQAALPIEFERREIPYAPKATLPISDLGHDLRLHYYADFICFDDVIVELKALKEIGDREVAQVINYLKASKKRRGLVLNFGATSFQYRRVVWG